MQRKTLVKLGLALLAIMLLSQAFMATASAQWDFPRLDELIFKIKWPWSVSLEAAKACEIDTYVGAIRLTEVDTLSNPPYGWTVTAAPGFHMCYIGVNCRDVTPETSGERFDFHGRTPGYPLYPLNLTAFRYALELMVGCNKTVWINDIYGYINVRLDTNVPPANVFWYNPSILPYPLDWDEAYNQLIAAGFSGTIGGDDWLMPNGQPLRTFYIMSPAGTPTSEEITRRHVTSWNAFFCGQSVADPPHDCNFVHEPTEFYQEIDTAFYDRDHDMYFLCWGLARNPDYLWWFFHPDADYPDWNNSPGLDYRPLNAIIDALFYCMWTEKTELRIAGPGPITVAESTKYYTDYPIAAGSEDVWIGVYSGSGTYPYRLADLEYGTDYTYVVSAGKNVGIHFLQDISLDPDMYLHIVYELEDMVPINSNTELQQVCFDIQWMLYYMCPYLTIYSRNYHDLYKPGLECWVPSLGYGSAAYQLKWTYASVHWTGVPVGGTINWHLPGPVNTLHPWLATSVYEVTILNRLYDGLLVVDAYTHKDIFWLAEHYKVEDWTGPSGEPGMNITWWIRNDIEWQDGDYVTADDFIWDYEFINSIKPAQLFAVWGYYHGCVKHNDYCFSIHVNTTGVWNFYAYTGGPTYPRKVWEPFYGDLAGAVAFRPWQVAYTDHVPQALWPEPPGEFPPTCLYGTGEWVFDYFDTTLGIIRVFKNPESWVRERAPPCRQLGSIHAPTSGHCLKTVTVESTALPANWNGTHLLEPNLLCYETLWSVTSPPPIQGHIWNWEACDDWNMNGVLDAGDVVFFELWKQNPLTPDLWEAPDRIVVTSVTMVGGNVVITGTSDYPKITKTAIGIDILNLDMKGDCTHTWTLYDNETVIATGTQTLARLAQSKAWVTINYQTVKEGWHVFILKIENGYGINYIAMKMYVLVGDVDNNCIVNMLDLYNTAKKFGLIGPQCWVGEDVDNNGIVNMLDLFIIAKLFGKTC